jgi:hypothetical protein
MNDLEPKNESRLLLGDDLETAKQFVGVTKELLDRRQAIAEAVQAANAQAEAEWTQVKADMLPEAQALQDKLFAAHNITKEDAEFPMWRIDDRYFEEHGLMFLLKDVESYKNEQVLEQYVGGKTQH